MKINLGFNSKRASRDMSFDNNTTYSFGEVQPIMSQFMLPDSDIKVSGKTLVRLSPLKVPSFARVHLEMVSRFVPMADVFAPFESMLSNIPFSHNGKQFVPNSVPMIYSNVLALALLPLCKWSVWDDNMTSVVTVSNQTESDTYSLNIIKAITPYTSLLGDGYKLLLSGLRQNSSTNSVIKPDGADFIFEVDSPTNAPTFVVCRLNSYGQRLRKVFVGLGYEPLSDVIKTQYLKVNILPLLAFYKAYFETYYPQRFVSFPSTKCFNLIDSFSGSSDNDYFTFPKFNGTFKDMFSDFLVELRDCFYAAQDDYISIHTSKPLNATSLSSLSFNDGFDGRVLSRQTGNLPQYELDEESPLFTDVALKTLRIFTNFVNKDSVIGKRMSSWVRQHFNAEIANQLFKDSNFVGRTSVPLQISDVFSTSDTAQGSGENATGESLGAYAGKGIGYGNCNFKFHAPVHGYFFIFACVVPDSRTFQGTDPTLLASTKYEFPQPEFDALGYELTDRRVFIPSNDVQTTTQSSVSSASFGFVPRYTGFKFKKNIVNGDMSRRSTASTFAPYYLDRIITHNDFQGQGQIAVNDIPSASPEWRFITRYGYLGDFDRLFINDNDLSPETDYFSETIDNFLSQTIFNVSLTDSLMPLKSSYDTVAEEDNNVKSVSAE